MSWACNDSLGTVAIVVFFFLLLVDWVVASWPSLFFFAGSLTNGEGFGDKMIWSQANVSLG